MNSAIYRCNLHLCGENQLGMPVLCLEHSVNALIRNVLCNSCGKSGEIIMSKRHLPFHVNPCKPGNVQQGASNKDSKCSIIHTCTSSTAKTAVSRPEFSGENVSYENIMYVTSF